METKPTTKCPTCGKPVEWSGKSDWRPFCSERCRLIDLGDWLDENHRFPDPDTDTSDTNDQNMQAGWIDEDP